MENNKLIAEFMGDGREYEIDINTKNLKSYHTSWDWLMTVVAKCRNESNSEDSHWESIYYSLEECDIDVTYKAVVKFINWYNKEEPYRFDNDVYDLSDMD